jgi:hypothetical protein
MKDSRTTKASETDVKPENQISDMELDKVVGGHRKSGGPQKEFLVVKPQPVK